MQKSDNGNPAGIFVPQAHLDLAAVADGVKMTFENVAEVIVGVVDVLSSKFLKQQFALVLKESHDPQSGF